MVRDQILAAAVRVFSQKGYHQAGMDEIAMAAGVAKGSLYYHFKGKSDLFAAVICDGLDDLRQRIGQAVEQSDHVEAVVASLIDAHVCLYEAFPELTSLIMDEHGTGLDEKTHSIISQAKTDYIQYVGNLIGQGIADGSLRPCDRDAAAAGYLNFLYAYWKRATPNTKPEQIIFEATRLVMQGLSN